MNFILLFCPFRILLGGGKTSVHWLVCQTGFIILTRDNWGWGNTLDEKELRFEFHSLLFSGLALSSQSPVLPWHLRLKKVFYSFPSSGLLWISSLSIPLPGLQCGGSKLCLSLTEIFRKLHVFKMPWFQMAFLFSKYLGNSASFLRFSSSSQCFLGSNQEVCKLWEVLYFRFLMEIRNVHNIKTTVYRWTGFSGGAFSIALNWNSVGNSV